MIDLGMRRRMILGDVRPKVMRGAEMGPLNNPLVRKTDGDVIYIDYAYTEALREQHRDSKSINPVDIVDVDFVWAARPLRDCLGTKGPLDYVVAAHVIEHVPDIVGWLFDVASILKAGGLLGLAIPDRRHTFDFARNESTVGEMVEAYLCKYRIPSIRQVFDHCFLGVKLDQRDSWKVDPSRLALPKFMDEIALPLAYSQAREIARAPRYIDSHCWVFTPVGWVSNIETLARIRLFPFHIEEIIPTLPGELEFIMRLRRCDPADAGIIDSVLRAKQRVATDASEAKYQELVSSKAISTKRSRYLRWLNFRKGATRG